MIDADVPLYYIGSAPTAEQTTKGQTTQNELITTTQDISTTHLQLATTGLFLIIIPGPFIHFQST